MLAAIIKEFRLLSRDLHGIAVLFLMPMLFMLIMSVALSQADDVNQNSKIALVGEQEDLININLIRSLEKQNIHVDFIELSALETAKQQLINKEYDILVINANLPTTSLEEEKPIELLASADMDQLRLLNLQGVIQKSYLQQKLSVFLTRTDSLSSPNPISQQLNAYLSKDIIVDQFINHEGSKITKPNSVQQSVPAWLIFGMFFIIIPLSNVMTCEKQTNTIVRLRLAKSSAFSLLFAKLVPYFLINQMQFVGMILLGTYLLPLVGINGFHLHGNYWCYGLLSIAISLSALGYALLVSVLARTAEQAVVLGGGGNIIMAALGGIMVPSYMMPETMQMISQISPMSWALRGFHNLLLNQYHFQQILPEWLSLIGFAFIFLLLACMSYCRQLKKQYV